MADEKNMDLEEYVKTNLEEFVPSENTSGLEEARTEDVIIPRIKVINALSPERTEGIATEGQILNSLTKEDFTGKNFIPFRLFYSHICWNPERDVDPRIFCRSYDGRIGNDEAGAKSCEQCGKCKFDNTQKGKAAQPKCTQYLNFLGFFEDDPMPVVLSFFRTGYNEGKKMLSLAKSLSKNAWDYMYKLDSKKVSKDRNTWYNIQVTMNGKTPPALAEIAKIYLAQYKSNDMKVDFEDTAFAEATSNTDEATEAEISG